MARAFGTSHYLYATPTGLEPATSAVTGRRANQLRYGASVGVARTPHCTSRAFCRDRNSNPSPIARRNHPVNTPCGCRMGANDERLDVAARDADAQPRPGRNMIEYRNVRKIFDEGTHAVEDCSLTIESRTTTVFVGSSGCGKTTLLRMVNRMVDPSAGSVLIDDVDVATKNPVELRRSIGYVMQHAGLLPHRTVLDNIAAPLVLDGMKRRRAREHAKKMLPTVGLDAEVTHKYPIQLSGGQQQRVGVARGLVADPNIMLMDEPFGAVDPIVREELQ